MPQKNNLRIVLIVDDEDFILKSLARELKDWADTNSLEIQTANNASKALMIVEEYARRIVLIISDLRMPGMKGSSFLIKVNKEHPEIETILLTGFADTEEIIKAIQGGVYSFIHKPWEPDYLVTEVNKAFQHGELRRKNEEYLKIVEEQLKWAGEMQKSILKPHLPAAHNVEFRLTYKPRAGMYCSGDYYDVLPLNGNVYIIMIGDVAGHGVRAALVTAILKSVIYPEYIQQKTSKNFSPADFLSWLNNRMNFELRKTSGLLITFFIGLVDLSKQSMTYANAGQTKPYIIRKRNIIEVPVSGTSLGVTESITYIQQEISFEQGDVFVLYTDGLTEIRNAVRTVQMEPRDLLSQVPYGHDFHLRLLQTALKEASAEEFTDDVTILSLGIL